MEENKNDNNTENVVLNNNSNQKNKIKIKEHTIFRIVSIILVVYAMFVLMPFSSSGNFYSTGLSPTDDAKTKHSLMSLGVFIVYAVYALISENITEDKKEKKEKLKWVALVAMMFMFCSGFFEFFVALILSPIIAICLKDKKDYKVNENSNIGLISGSINGILAIILGLLSIILPLIRAVSTGICIFLPLIALWCGKDGIKYMKNPITILGYILGIASIIFNIILFIFLLCFQR